MNEQLLLKPGRAEAEVAAAAGGSARPETRTRTSRASLRPAAAPAPASAPAPLSIGRLDPSARHIVYCRIPSWHHSQTLPACRNRPQGFGRLLRHRDASRRAGDRIASPASQTSRSRCPIRNHAAVPTVPSDLVQKRIELFAPRIGNRSGVRRPCPYRSAACSTAPRWAGVRFRLETCSLSLSEDARASPQLTFSIGRVGSCTELEFWPITACQ